MVEYYWHVHHHALFEALTKPIERRIDYIKQNKPKKEIKLRLKLLHKVKDVRHALSELKEYDDKEVLLWKEYKDKEALLWKEFYKDKEALLWKEYKDKEALLLKKYEDKEALLLKLLKTHKKECPNCPWNGTSIFC